MDFKRVLSTARNVGESQFGKTLLRGLDYDNHTLTRTLTYIQSQSRHTEVHYDQLRNTFLNEMRVRPNPTIILERPPSGAAARRAFDRETRREPGYMQATFTKPGRHLPNIRTIDAFSVETSRMSNPWDPKHSGIPRTYYRCIAKPSMPLSRPDKRDLAKTFHRLVAAYAMSPEQNSANTGGARKASHPKRRLTSKTRGQSSARVKDKHKTPRLFIADGHGRRSRKLPKTVTFEALPKLSVTQQRMYSIHSDLGASAKEKKTDTEQRDDDTDASTTPTRPKATRRKHRKVKRKQDTAELRREGLILVTV